MGTSPKLAEPAAAALAPSSNQDPRVERSRVAILAAVRELLTERGVAGVTVEAIVSRSRVARSTLYRHFATTTEVIAAAMDQLLPAPLIPSQEGPLRERLIWMLRELQQMSGSPLVPSVLAWFAVSYQAVTLEPESEPDNRPHLEALKNRIVSRHREPIEGVLREAIAAGELSEELDIDMAIAQLLGPLLFVTMVPQQALPDQLYERVVDDFLLANGLL